MRIRWRGVARVAAIVLVALFALRLLPGLLRAPEPPPLGADVGLPRAKPAASREVVTESARAVTKSRSKQRPKPARAAGPRRKRGPKPWPKRHVVADQPASTAVIGTRTQRRHRRHHRHRRKDQASPPTPPVEASSEPAPAYVPPPAEPVPEYVPPPPAEAAPDPVPESPPAPQAAPGDGSEEFAPH